jgi:membrane protein DedA with SNARE-associated domain
MEGWPVLGIYLFFLFGAVARSQALYWLGRGVANGLLRSRWGERLDSAQVHRAVSSIERWGMPIVPLAFLTVGFQSAVFSAAGLVRVHWLRFSLWSIPGALVWAAVWGGGGMAVVAGGLALPRQEPWVAALVGVLVAVALLLLVLRQRRRRQQQSVLDHLAGSGTRGRPPEGGA